MNNTNMDDVLNTQEEIPESTDNQELTAEDAQPLDDQALEDAAGGITAQMAARKPDDTQRY